MYQQLPHSGGEGGEPQGVCHSGTGFAHPVGDLLLGHAIVGEQHEIALRLLHGIEVFTLEVFNQPQLHDLFVVRLNDNGGHLG